MVDFKYFFHGIYKAFATELSATNSSSHPKIYFEPKYLKYFLIAFKKTVLYVPLKN